MIMPRPDNEEANNQRRQKRKDKKKDSRKERKIRRTESVKEAEEVHQRVTNVLKPKTCRIS